MVRPSCSCSINAMAIRPTRLAPSCSCTARRWPASRPSICRSRDVPTPHRWITSPASASMSGPSTWRATAAPPRIATTTRRSRKAPTTATPRPSTSRSCAARSRSWSMAFHRERCARRCLPNVIRRWSPASRSTQWCGLAKARRRSPSARRSCQTSSRSTAAR